MCVDDATTLRCTADRHRAGSIGVRSLFFALFGILVAYMSAPPTVAQAPTLASTSRQPMAPRLILADKQPSPLGTPRPRRRPASQTK